MKKLFIYLALLAITGTACKKEKIDPVPSPNTSVCNGSTWTYSITANPAFIPGSMYIQYQDGNMSSVMDTTMAGSWSKSVVAQTSSGAFSANLTIMTSSSYLTDYPNGFSSTLTIHISKDGVQQTLNGGSGPLLFCSTPMSSSCSPGTSVSFSRYASCN